jgi:hypothetical protein
VQDNGLAETFLVSGCADGQVSLWTLNGVPVGRFGQPEPWDLDALSQRTSKASYDADLSGSLNTLSEATIASSLDVRLEERGGGRAQVSPIAALAAGDRSVYKSFPSAGEVWVKIEMDGIKQVRPFHCEVTGHAQVPPKVVLAVVTVTRLDEVRNEIKGWCGLAPDKRELVAPVMEFLSDRESGQWIREESLSDMVGRIYEDRSAGAPFKVQFFRCRDKRWLAVDPAGNEHVIYYVTKTYFGLRPPRSISLYYRRLEIIAQLEQASAAKQQLASLEAQAASATGSGSGGSFKAGAGSFKRRGSLSIAAPATGEPTLTKGVSRRGSFLDLFEGQAKASTSSASMRSSPSSRSLGLDGAGDVQQEPPPPQQQQEEQPQEQRQHQQQPPKRTEAAAAKAQKPNAADPKQVSASAERRQPSSPGEAGRELDAVREPEPTRDPYPSILVPAGPSIKSLYSSLGSPTPPSQPLSSFSRDNPSWRHRSALRRRSGATAAASQAAASSAQTSDRQPVRQRVHAIADVPVDFAQLRATLSFGTERQIL